LLRYFHSGGSANTRHGDGSLSTTAPGQEEADKFMYDPRDPVPTTGGNHLMTMNYFRGPLSQEKVEERDDILVYLTAPLASDIEITGPVKVVLYAASCAPDTDFTAKLVDVHPGGKTYNIADGIIRSSRRNQSAAPELIMPGEVYEYRIDLWATSNLFKAGHRIGVEISSSNFPRFDRNTNTGVSGRDSADLQPALQTVLHNERYPSHIVLPIIPR
jgi:putative CocE/NonD family hydrolase